MGALPDNCASVDDAMRIQTDVIVQFDVVADYRVGANMTPGTNPGAGTNNGGRMNVIGLSCDCHKKLLGKRGTGNGKHFVALYPFPSCPFMFY
jgi:hypothetical protein